MMQVWANRLDLLERGQLKAASTRLTIRLEGVPTLGESVELNAAGALSVQIG